MEMSWDQAARAALGTDDGQRLLSKKEEIGRIAASEDGQRIKERMERDQTLSRAMETGDTDALREALTGILQTPEGARLAAQLNGLLGK